MARAKRRLNATAMALSIAAHAVVLTALALHAPKLVIPHEDAGPPEPIIPILIMPRTPPTPPGATRRPQPIRLHGRRLRHEQPPENVAPFVAPKEAPTPPSPPSRPVTAPRVTVQPSPNVQLSTTLRNGIVGCANPALLNPGERERCLERLGRGARAAPYMPPETGRDKQTALEAAVVARDRRVRLRDAPPPAGLAAPDADSGASNRNKPLYTPNLPPLRP